MPTAYYFKKLLLLLPFIILISCSSHLYFEQTNGSEVDQDIANIVRLYQARGDLNDREKSILAKMCQTFLRPVKYQLPADKWQRFYRDVMSKQQSIERSIIDVYGDSIYGLGGGMFYATEMPHAHQTHFNVSQVGLVNIMYLNDTSFNDRADIEYLFNYSSNSIEQLFLSDPVDKETFNAKLELMNDGFINVLLVSNEAQRKAFGLEYATAYSKSRYGFSSQHINFYNWIESKYVNILYSVTFLHELVHSYLAINRTPIEHMKYDRNMYTSIQDQLTIEQKKNIMLEEGLAEYITRNHSVWSKLPIFESVHLDVSFKHKQGMPLLNIVDMQRYYYGKEKRSFKHVHYGLLSAHSLVDYLVQSYSVSAVVKLIYLDDLGNNAESIFGKPWGAVIRDWHIYVTAL